VDTIQAFWIDHPPMVIDMNETRLETIEQIRDFLAGTGDMTFTVPSEEAKRASSWRRCCGASATSVWQMGTAASCLPTCSAHLRR